MLFPDFSSVYWLVATMTLMANTVTFCIGVCNMQQQFMSDYISYLKILFFIFRSAEMGAKHECCIYIFVQYSPCMVC